MLDFLKKHSQIIIIIILGMTLGYLLTACALFRPGEREPIEWGFPHEVKHVNKSVNKISEYR